MSHRPNQQDKVIICSKSPKLQITESCNLKCHSDISINML